MNIGKRVISGLKWSALAKLASQITIWFSTIYVMRLLSPDDYGLMAISMAVMAIFSLVSDIGLGGAVIQAKNITEEEKSKAFGLSVLLNILIVLLLYFSAPVIAEFYHDRRINEILKFLSLQFFIGVSVFIPETQLKRDMRFGLISLAEISGSLVSSALSLYLANTGQGVWSLVYGSLFGNLIRSAIIVLSSKRFIKPSFSLIGIMRLAAYGSQMTLTKIFNYIFSQVDIFIAGKFLTSEAVGVYSVTLHLAMLPLVKIMSVVNQVAFSAFARLQDKRQDFLRGFSLSICIGSYFAFPTLYGILAIAPELVTVVLGEKWESAIFPLQIVCSVMPLRVITILMSTAVSATGRADVDFKNSISGAFILLLCFLVGVRDGSVGLAMAWLFGLPLVVAINTFRAREITGLNFKALFRATYKPFLASVFMVLTIYLMKKYALSSFPDVTKLFLMVFIGIFTYAFVIWLIDRNGIIGIVRFVRGLQVNNS